LLTGKYELQYPVSPNIYNSLTCETLQKGDHVSEPFIAVSTWRIKEGKLEDLKRCMGEFAEIIEANKP